MRQGKKATRMVSEYQLTAQRQVAKRCAAQELVTEWQATMTPSRVRAPGCKIGRRKVAAHSLVSTVHHMA
eukprot:366410-Chlamydomonas_euryale.AAC.19